MKCFLFDHWDQVDSGSEWAACTCVQSEPCLVKTWELLLRNVRFIQESNVLDECASLPIL